MRMRMAVTAALFLGLLTAADLTHLDASRSLIAYNRYSQLRVQEIGVVKVEGTRQLTDEELRIRVDVAGAFSQVRRHIEDWQSDSFLALGFLGCGLSWLAMILFARPASEPGSLLHGTLKGSMIGAFVIGTCYTCSFSLLIWLLDEGDRIYDRLEFEGRWLIGAIGGAGIGALIGLLVASALKHLRRNQDSEKGEPVLF